jgi:hypothetical protein
MSYCLALSYNGPLTPFVSPLDRHGFPKFHTVALRVPNPGKAPIGILLSFGVDVDPGNGKIGKQLVEIVHAKIEHDRLLAVSEVGGVLGEKGRNGHSGLQENAADSYGFGHGYSPLRMISSSLGLCLIWRPVRGSVSMTRAGLGCPTSSRALALTALVAENVAGLRFVMARLSME